MLKDRKRDFNKWRWDEEEGHPWQGEPCDQRQEAQSILKKQGGRKKEGGQ